MAYIIVLFNIRHLAKYHVRLYVLSDCKQGSSVTYISHLFVNKLFALVFVSILNYHEI